ncbi:hypothetical protein ETB97_009488 [Aspergillus alliaceus]|uniref:Uncharacterized protein n=1 Tax=Petromyces alliaceus TaxID=209559 RepID=A0A8H6E8V2_PETAA|nr:hypothetical protein ETB97_009488 [Aspergillus burnettii]
MDFEEWVNEERGPAKEGFGAWAWVGPFGVEEDDDDRVVVGREETFRKGVRGGGKWHFASDSVIQIRGVVQQYFESFGLAPLYSNPQSGAVTLTTLGLCPGAMAQRKLDNLSMAQAGG